MIVKRLFDVLFSAMGLLFFSPILVVLAILIKAGDKGPIFYRGVRVGQNGRVFRIFKFRSMVVNAEKIGGASTADDDSRITRIGKFLRKYKLDELPQLLNVLKGEMSFVGPRPQVPWAVDLYTKEESRLLTLRPGLTDYASVIFSNEGAILHGTENPDQVYLEKIAPAKIKLGLMYVQNRSLMTDIRIICVTILRIFEGVLSKRLDIYDKLGIRKDFNELTQN